MVVVKIAKKGGAITDAEKLLAFTSNRACLMELQIGIKAVTTDGSGNATDSITHSLGYFPAVVMFEKGFFPDGKWYISTGYDYKITTTKINFNLSGYDPYTTYYFHYRISGNRQDNAVGSGNNNVSGKMRISKPGYSANTETDSRNMIFFSGANVPKIDTSLSGSFTESINDYPYPTVKTIPHNLGYVPVFHGLLDSGSSDGNGNMVPSIDILYGGFSISGYADSTNIYFECRTSGSTESWTVKYKITRDKIE